MKAKHIPEPIEQSKAAQGGFQIFLGIVFLIAIYGASVFGSSIWLIIGLVPVYWISLKTYKFYKEDGYVSNRVLTTMLSCLFPLIFIVAIIAGFDMSRL